MNIGKVFKDEREKLNVSRKSMAERLGLNSSALWKIEAGKTNPKPDTIRRFCRETCISPAYFYISSLDKEDFFVIG